MLDIIPDNSKTNDTQTSTQLVLGITHGISVQNDDFGLLNKYRLQAASRQLMPLERIRICCKVPLPDKKQIDVMRKKGTGIQPVFYRGLMRCHNGWQCPVCSSAISEHRRIELTKAIDTTGYTPVMLTYTMSHSHNEPLDYLISRLSLAWKTLTAQRAYKQFKNDYGYVGAIRTLEITYGQENGWHPHFHVLMLLNDRFQDYKAEMTLELYDVWNRSLEKHERSCSEKHGVDVTFNKEDIAGYVSKGGMGKEDLPSGWTVTHELTKAQNKIKKEIDGRFTPFKLLKLYIEGKTWAGNLFQEYCYAVKGRSQLHWSRGLQQLLGIQQIRDDQIKEFEHESELFRIAASIPLDTWRLLAHEKLQGELLVAVSNDDKELFIKIMSQVGVHRIIENGITK